MSADADGNGVPDECAAPLVNIVSASPPLDNPFVAGQQPFSDVLDTGSGAALTAGSGAGPYSITLSSPIPPGHCTTLTFAGTPPGTRLQYQSQPGNVSMDAATNTQDLLVLIQALNNGAANMTDNLARYNVNRSTGANPSTRRI